MAYSVDNIIPVNVIIGAAGLGYADFTSAFVFADAADLRPPPLEPGILTEKKKRIKTQSGKSLLPESVPKTARGETFPVDTFRDYSGVTEVGEDFSIDSDIYLIATRFFAQIPRPPSLSVWMKKPEDENLIETVNKANEAAWRYNYFFKTADFTEENLLVLSDWSDNTGHPVWYTSTSAETIDQAVTDDIVSRLAKKGNRHMLVGWRAPEAVEPDPSQAHTMVQVAATFAKFRPNGLNTAITAEYQVLPGVDGDELKTRHYNALKAKKAVFFTPIELAGQKDTSRVINSVSMSSYGEFIDDVINIDVLKNHLQVDGYNHIANVGTKRPLTPKGYAGLLNVLNDTLKRFYNNGVLGEGMYVDEVTGAEKTAKFGYIVLSVPEDVLKLTPAQRKKREFPPTKILVILARAGHIAELNVTVE
ncbi:DUF3383 family protein [Enterobacter sp. WCHEn045836]|uniref:DUF3383 family protein n=1 Tax=Enterobacter sp. WCHEn045836 TaxID=2497434 RepID=UPI000F816C0B|nr:DUF3383 family protein [Enterobacter sp. WCHEn045836]RTQ01297.1 DUF3383 family protein [Enterobacter sp. WCHEn045836]